MRSYMGNTKSADTIVPMALNTTPACQRSSCADASGRQHPACFALFREKKSPNLSLLQNSLRSSCRTSAELPSLSGRGCCWGSAVGGVRGRPRILAAQTC